MLSGSFTNRSAGTTPVVGYPPQRPTEETPLPAAPHRPLPPQARTPPPPSRSLLPDDQRHVRGLVEAGPEIHVDEVQPHRLMLDQGLARTGFGCRDVLPDHDLRAAVRVDADCLRHVISPCKQMFTAKVGSD